MARRSHSAGSARKTLCFAPTLSPSRSTVFTSSADLGCSYPGWRRDSHRVGERHDVGARRVADGSKTAHLKGPPPPTVLVPFPRFVERSPLFARGYVRIRTCISRTSRWMSVCELDTFLPSRRESLRQVGYEQPRSAELVNTVLRLGERVGAKHSVFRALSAEHERLATGRSCFLGSNLQTHAFVD